MSDDLTLNIRLTRQPDGRIKIKSPDVPGLFLASHDFKALCRDLGESLPDLLKANRGINL
jgi:hypothetical protein